jgi:multiple sugar transport system ATP-binding protein
LTLPGTGFKLTVLAELRQSLGPWTGRHVVLGIRPEHLQLRKDSATPGAAPPETQGMTMELPAKVNVIEPLGNDVDLYAETALHDRLVARVQAGAAGDVAIGAQVRLSLDLRKAHFFEPGETGMNLSLKGQGAAASAGSASPSNEPAHAIA